MLRPLVVLVAIVLAVGVVIGVGYRNMHGAATEPATSTSLPPPAPSHSRDGYLNPAVGGNTKSLSPRQSTSWAAQLHETRNYYDFIAKAAKAAYDGDGRAAYYVFTTMMKCGEFQREYRGAENPDAQFNIDESTRKLPQWIYDRDRDLFNRCRGLIKGDPFAQLPKRTDGYPMTYWRAQALVDGDELAIANRAGESLAAAVNAKSDDLRNTLVSNAQNDLNEVVSSKDPEVLFLVGMLLADGRRSPDPSRGFAMALAACDLGYGCSSTNPDNVFSVCKDSGACPADADFAFYLQQMVGAPQFAQIYAKAQDFKSLLATGNSASIAQFIGIHQKL